MSKKPPDEPDKLNQPTSAEGEREPPKKRSVPPKARHSPTPREDAEWDARMDELQVQRDELHNTKVAQPVTIDPHELVSMVKRLEALMASSKELGQETTRFGAHIEEALLHLREALSELAVEWGK